MKNLIYFLFLIVGICQGTDVLTKNNEERIFKSHEVIGGRNYFFSSILLSHQDAIQLCNDEGMALVSFETEEEYKLVMERILSYGLSSIYTSGMFHDFDNSRWMWTGSGQFFTYTDWAPESSTPNVVACMIASPDGWYSVGCESNAQLLCEEN